MVLNFKLKEIINHDGYFAGEYGNIYSYWTLGSTAEINYDITPRKLKGRLTNAGYLGVCIKHNKKEFKSRDVHRLICRVFYGKSNLTASHLDGNKLNNKLSNLKYETYSDNHKRKLIHGTHDRGCNNSRSKINKEELKEIRKLLKEN